MNRPHHRWTHRHLAPFSALVALLVAGCGDPSMQDKAGNAQQQRATLEQRPTMQQTIDTYTDMQQRIRQRLNTEIGPMNWHESRPLSTSGCGDFPDVDEADSRSLTGWTSPGNLPDAQWPQAVRIVTDITREYGFDPPQANADEPGNHHITSIGPYGATIEFGTAANTVLGVGTGCHLTTPEPPTTPSAP